MGDYCSCEILTNLQQSRLKINNKCGSLIIEDRERESNFSCVKFKFLATFILDYHQKIGNRDFKEITLKKRTANYSVQLFFSGDKILK
jgi:hypothetical protein